MFANRQRPAHFPPSERHNVPIIIFVTVCTQSRRPILAKHDSARLLRFAWTRARRWKVGRYVIMPDHIHLFCSPATFPAEESLAVWVRYWKNIAARQWPRREEHPLWQRGFWDRQLRHHTHYGERWDYVRANPVRNGLVHYPDEWPFQGEMNELRW
jgi:REP element-mobilizing transposase RayT